MQLSNFHNSQIAKLDNEEKLDQHRHRFGALSDLISDPTVEEIWINNPARIFFARDGKTELAKIVRIPNSPITTKVQFDLCDKYNLFAEVSVLIHKLT